MRAVSALTSLNLAYTKLGAEGAKAIADALRVNGSLTSLNLVGNKLGDEGWCAIFDALRDNPQNKIAKWDLASQGITPSIIKSLVAYMASFSLSRPMLRRGIGWTPTSGWRTEPTRNPTACCRRC